MCPADTCLLPQGHFSPQGRSLVMFCSDTLSVSSKKSYINSDKHSKYNGYSWVNSTYSQQCACQHRHSTGHRSIYSPQHKFMLAKFLCCTSPQICIGQAEEDAVCMSICIYPGLHGYNSTLLNVQPIQSTVYM